MEPLVQTLRQIQSPLYDRRLMILILKKTNVRRSFSENCRYSKIKTEHRYRHNEPTKENKETETETDKQSDKQQPDQRIYEENEKTLSGSFRLTNE